MLTGLRSQIIVTRDEETRIYFWLGKIELQSCFLWLSRHAPSCTSVLDAWKYDDGRVGITIFFFLTHFMGIMLWPGRVAFVTCPCKIMIWITLKKTRVKILWWNLWSNHPQRSWSVLGNELRNQYNFRVALENSRRHKLWMIASWHACLAFLLGEITSDSRSNQSAVHQLTSSVQYLFNDE